MPIGDHTPEDVALAEPPPKSQLPLLASHDPADLRQWLAELCQFLDISSTDLAKAAGVVPSTLNRFLNNPRVKHRLSATTIAKIQAITPILAAGARLLTAPGNGVPLGARRKRLSRKAAHLTQYHKPVIVRVVGRVQAGVWREAMELPLDEQTATPMLIRGPVDPRKVFGLEVVGDSMDLVYPEGSVVACVKLYDLDRNPKSGERVVVQRRRPDGLIESTIKELLIDGEGRAWLMPRSSNPEHQAGWRVEAERLQDGEGDLTVLAIVVGSFRTEPGFR